MLKPLIRNPKFQGRRGPLILCIMDGIGLGKYQEGDAFFNAYKPTLENMLRTLPNTKLKAHGTAVGLPSDEDMGNSEVGHNAIGCGRVFAQGAKLINQAITTGKIFDGTTWKEIITNCKNSCSSLHFLGLFSDGNVHSHIDHLKSMIDRAVVDGINKIRIHILLDGRDVPETSALLYVEPFEQYLQKLRSGGCDVRIASGGGRMNITMDRYGANWDMVRKGWNIHVHGNGRLFKSAKEAIETLRNESKVIDQDLPGFVIQDDSGNPIGKIKDGDSVIFFNFRGDRALEITQAFEENNFTKFDRTPRPNVFYAGMMEYDGDLKVPKKYLVNPPAIARTSGEYLCMSGIRTMAISETQKYGHVTYFYNGNRTGKFDEKLEDYVEIRSDIIPFEQRPWMKSAEITDKVVEAIESGNYNFIRLNYPNGDMVGHTGVYESTIIAVESIDIGVKRIAAAVKKVGGVLILTADHGNCDDMYQHDKNGRLLKDNFGKIESKTSHSLNPVPFIVYDPESKGEYKTDLKQGLGISSVAATCIEFLGFRPPEDYDPSIITFN